MTQLTIGKMVNQVYRAKPSDLFLFSELNRPVNEEGSRYKKLLASIERKNMLAQYPILVYRNKQTRKLTIVDGQHRYTVAKNLGLDIYYIIIDSLLSLPDLASAVGCCAMWRPMDYILAYSNAGYQEYDKILAWLKDKSPINAHVGASLLCGYRGNGGPEFSESLRNGTLSVVAESLASDVWEIANALIDRGGIDFGRQSTTMRAIAMMCLTPGFDRAWFDGRIKCARKFLHPLTRTELMLGEFKNLYNHCCRTPINFTAYWEDKRRSNQMQRLEEIREARRVKAR